MPAATYDMTIEQGTTFQLGVTITNSDTTPFDLTTWDARSMIRKKYTDVVETAEFTITITTPASGVMSLSLTPTETAAIPAGSYMWDLEIYTAADADVRRLLQGSITVSPEVTKP